MIAAGLRSRVRRLIRRFVGDEAAGVLVFMAVAMVPMLGMTGLAIDTGRAMIARLQMSRAVDAATLAGARVLRQGQGQALAQQEAFAVAAANGVAQGFQGTTMTIGFATSPTTCEQTVTMTASRQVPTLFMRLLGRSHVAVQSRAEARSRPLDLVLVLDRSYSLAQAGVWGQIQNAAASFVDFFDEDPCRDQLGLVSFQIVAEVEFPLGSPFKSGISNAIGNLTSIGETNVGEGLNFAFGQITGPTARPGASRAVVFFTDGNPTAFLGAINGAQRLMAVDPQQGWFRGWFENPGQVDPDSWASPAGCGPPPPGPGVTSCSPTPDGLNVWTVADVLNVDAPGTGLAAANQIRSAGVVIYAIALDDTNIPVAFRPDMSYLAQLANVNGATDPSQPQGQTYSAASAADMQSVFQTVAQDLLVRLSN